MWVSDGDEERSTSEQEYRVDDLARAAGVTTTTIRLYQSKGLLPPPRLVGRTGYYGQAHLTRLRVIAQLQEQGFSLAGIAALIQRWESGGGRFRIPDERFVESGAALAQMGVPLGDILDEWAALSAMTDAVAERFADLFERHLLPDSWQEGLDEEQVTELAATLGQLRSLGEQVLLAALDDALARVTAARFAELFGD
jgi:DNA-binding transcriptional MerR regulator